MVQILINDFPPSFSTQALGPLPGLVCRCSHQRRGVNMYSWPVSADQAAMKLQQLQKVVRRPSDAMATREPPVGRTWRGGEMTATNEWCVHGVASTAVEWVALLLA